MKRHRGEMVTSLTYTRRVSWLISALLLIRIIALFVSPYGLHGDEAQYWSWSQTPDWGYFSKPPMIAWVIAATTSFFGNAEWAVRLGSPLLHSASAMIIYLTGKRAFSARSGFWAAIIYMLMPGVWVSSMIISTDAALLFFWALALYAWISLRQSPLWRYALLLGAAFGFGVMSKYAMAFFIPPLIFSMLIDIPARRALLGIKGICVIVLAALIITPNIIWNVTHDFATLTHVAANTNLEGKTKFFHPMQGVKFFRDQFGVFGPVPFILLICAVLGLSRHIRKTKTTHRRLLWCLAAFTLTPLLLISTQAFLSRANANWAVSGYVSAAILLGYLSTEKISYKNWLNGGLFIQSLFCSGLLIISLFPPVVDSLGFTNSVKRLRGWPETIALVQTRFNAGHEGRSFEAILFDNRLVFYEGEYYGRGKITPSYIWQSSARPKNHAQLTASLPVNISRQENAPILFVQYYAEDTLQHIDEAFTRIVPLAPINIELGGGKTRELKAWALYGYRPRGYQPQTR